MSEADETELQHRRRNDRLMLKLFDEHGASIQRFGKTLATLEAVETERMKLRFAEVELEKTRLEIDDRRDGRIRALELWRAGIIAIMAALAASIPFFLFALEWAMKK